MPAAWTASCLSDARVPAGCPPRVRTSRERPKKRRGSDTSGAAVRASAAQVVHAVRAEGQSLTAAIEAAAPGFDERDAALLQAMSFGALRLLPRLDAVTAQLLARPLQRGDLILKDLMAVGLFQLMSMRIPEHATVAATVGAARTLGRPRAAGLINAMLRRFQRERQTLLARIAEDQAARWLFPNWLLKRLRDAWPEHWQAIVDACNEQPPMTLRVNRLRASTRDYAELLASNGLSARPLPHLSDALMLDRPVPTRSLPGFAEGLVSVQDGSAQLAAVLLDAQGGERVLDACAAPGGKTAHILERSGEFGGGQRSDSRGAGALVTAIDADAERLETLRRNLERLGLSATVAVADAAHASLGWPGAPYQGILLDAPCSATGVIRRHPDIKWLRRDTDIAALCHMQRVMLDALWPLLAPGGRMLYATCSVLPQENDHQIRAFLERQTDAVERPIDAAWGLARDPGRQLLPESGAGDGFYYALLEKTALEKTA